MDSEAAQKSIAKQDSVSLPEIEGVEIIQLIDTLGMCHVYKARQLFLDRIVAVKVLALETAHDTELLRKFETEAKLTSSLSHPNIVNLISYGLTANSQPYLIMEYLEGISLAQELEQNGRLTPLQFQQIFLPILSALEAAHGIGLVHGDIKPANLMFCRTESRGISVKIVDFGIAKIVASEGNARVTETGAAVGTPKYMSPEQIAKKTLDGRSDLYSLACVMYESLSGECPYTGGSACEVMQKHIFEPSPTISGFSRKVDIRKDLARVILSALAKDPALRPQSASKFAGELSVVLECITLDKVPMLKKTAGTVRTRIGVAIGLAGMLLLGGVLCLNLSGVRNSAKSPNRLIKRQSMLEQSKTLGGNRMAKPGQSANEQLPEKPADRCIYYLRRASQHSAESTQTTDRSSEMRHVRAASEAYKLAASYTLVNGQASMVTGRCYLMVAAAAMRSHEIEGDRACLDEAFDFATRALKTFGKEGSIPDLPEDLVIPDGINLPTTLAAKVASYQILASIIECDSSPSGHGTTKQAVDYGKKAIRLAESDSWQCRLAGQCALALTTLYLKEGKKDEASRLVNQVESAMRKAESERGELSHADTLCWQPVATAYDYLAERQRAARIRNHMKEIESTIDLSR